jgi:hypothetical protein
LGIRRQHSRHETQHLQANLTLKVRDSMGNLGALVLAKDELQRFLKATIETSVSAVLRLKEATYAHLLSECLAILSIARRRRLATSSQSKASVRKSDPADVVPRDDEIWRLSTIF